MEFASHEIAFGRIPKLRTRVRFSSPAPSSTEQSSQLPVSKVLGVVSRYRLGGSVISPRRSRRDALSSQRAKQSRPGETGGLRSGSAIRRSRTTQRRIIVLARSGGLVSTCTSRTFTPASTWLRTYLTRRSKTSSPDSSKAPQRRPFNLRPKSSSCTSSSPTTSGLRPSVAS